MHQQRTYQLLAETLFHKLNKHASGRTYATRYSYNGLVKDILLLPVRLANGEDSCVIFPRDNKHISELIILDTVPAQFDRARGVFDYTKKFEHKPENPVVLCKLCGGKKDKVWYINEPNVGLIKDVPYSDQIFQKIACIAQHIHAMLIEEYSGRKEKKYPYQDIPSLASIRTQPEPTET